MKYSGGVWEGQRAAPKRSATSRNLGRGQKNRRFQGVSPSRINWAHQCSESAGFYTFFFPPSLNYPTLRDPVKKPSNICWINISGLENYTITDRCS